MTTELTINIPIGDWDTEYQVEEPKLQGDSDLIELLKNPQNGPQKIGRLAIVARERGNAPNNILPPNKLLLNAGAAVEVSQIVARRKTKRELPNGKEIEVRDFVASVREDGNQSINDTHQHHVTPPSPINNNNHGFVYVESETALQRAQDYLAKVVPGYICGRMEIIALNGGDVRQAAKELKKRIDEIVKRLE